MIDKSAHLQHQSPSCSYHQNCHTSCS